MANKRIGCSAGKTSLIDPNSFSGQDSFSNVSVPLEDLTISVQLKTFKKGRTLLTASNGINTTQSSQTVKINFIEGSVINGEKVLTTKYTDLTTVLDKGRDGGENLGITNIDIDFNSSNTPLITINFIDLRGSSIFQNESELLNGENKYSTFFESPYPIYELTIKGYYGQPVKYCLHMTKFNSRFNSKTGNFEITANFIGYTYAMLSDMLLGVLKAIPYTDKGSKKYEEMKKINPSLLNLNELMIEISKIDNNVSKIVSNDSDASLIKYYNDNIEIIEELRNIINGFAINIDFKNDSNNDYKYIVFDDYNEKFYNDYLKLVVDNIKKFNENGNGIGYFIDVDKFKNIGNLKHLNISINELKNNSVFGLGNQNEVVLNISNRIINENKKFNLYDLSSLFSILDKNLIRLTNDKKNSENNLANTLKDTIKNNLGFEPTVRNIINTFTTAVEIFLSVIYDVSIEAEKSKVRISELKNVFIDDNNSDLKKKVQDKFFPFPDYRENNQKDGFKQKYLGTRGVLKNPDNVDELVFINNLFKGFLKAKQVSNEGLLDYQNQQNTWVSVNPFDTLLYNDSSPYNRLGDNPNSSDVILLMMIRSMIYLGYTNESSSLDTNKIISIAENEANAVINNPNISDNVKKVLSNVNISDFINIAGYVDDKNDKLYTPHVIEKSNSGDFYYYDYIFPNNRSKTLKVLPISGDFKGEWNSPKNTNNQTLLSKSFDTLFLTNYNSIEDDGSGNLNKPIDGGKYIDIKGIFEFNNKITGNEFNNGDSTTITYSDLKSGRNILNNVGSYGINEIKNINFGDNLDILPSMYVFYKDKFIDGERPFSKDGENNGLGLKRKDKTINNFDLPQEITSNSKIYSGKNQFQLKSYSSSEYPKFRGPRLNTELHDKYGENRYLFGKLLNGNNNITYPYIEQKYFGEGVQQSSEQITFSLFSSKLYYYQDKRGRFKDYNRALLFLNTLEFNGNSFENDEILNLFKNSGGFVHAPRLWCAYIGGLIWRADKLEPIYDGDNRIIGGGSGSFDPILWNYLGSNTQVPIYDKIFETPDRKSHWKLLIEDAGIHPSVSYDPYHKLLTTLPTQVKKEFKQVFFDFVNGSYDNIIGISWGDLKENLEIWKSDSDSYISFIDNIYNNLDCSLESVGNLCLVNNNFYNNSNLNKKDYKIILPVETLSEKINNNKNLALFLELDDESESVRRILKSLTEEVVIANSTYGIWNEKTSFGTNTQYMEIKTSVNNLETYVKTIVDKFSKINEIKINEIKKNKVDIFGSESDDVIKFQLYNMCKNIYDKWVGGATDGDNIVFQCGGGKPTRNNLDYALAKKNRPNDTKARLIDSFRFVTRSFRDIGDDFYIDPRPINTFLTDNPNSSFYDAISNLLASNNFDFIALPSFINFNDIKTMESMFDNVNYKDAIEDGICGPSFVCVYVGQKSKHLDFNGSDYTNDGFDVQCDGNGNMRTTLPIDFTTANGEHENNVAVFKVGYSQQNQNIFKDIVLDQSEFTETDESLRIVDDISKTGSENQRHFGGQNLYSVNSVRSYKTEVEMMGNAMVQPMMYFQLDNIPMFHGAYMITHVKHNIKPNTMTTHFTGVRIRHPETPLLKSNELYMSLLDGVEFTATKTTTSAPIGGVNTVVSNLQSWGTAFNNVIPTQAKKYDPSWSQSIFDEKIMTEQEVLRRGPRGTYKGEWGETFNYIQFANDFLNGINAPLTNTNIWFMFSWLRGELPNVKYTNNPLSTTQNGFGGLNASKSGNNVKGYPTYKDGLNASITTIKSKNGTRYSTLLKALKLGTLLPIEIWEFRE